MEQGSNSQLSFTRTSGLGAAVAAGKFFHTSSSVDEFLLASEKRMAGGADADSNISFGRASVINRTARANHIGLLIIGMNVRLHVEKRGEASRKPVNSQVMTKVEDPILMAWERTRANNRDRAAIVDSQGKVARTFLEIEDRAHQFANELEKIAPGQVLAVQIGNHSDWPSLFLACLRNRVVVLPLNKRLAMSKNRVRWKSVWRQL